MKLPQLTCATLLAITLSSPLYADVFHRFKVAQGDGSFESGQALCDSITASRGNGKTTMCDPVYNNSSNKSISVTDGDTTYHTIEPNHWLAYYSDEIYLIKITVKNNNNETIYSDPSTHNDWYGDGLFCDQGSCIHW